jgi:hypothetical protein
MGKMGRAETALDPAPIGMIETVVLLKPYAEWPVHEITRPTARWSTPPAHARRGARRLAAVSDIPGVAPSWLQPIETRVVMLSTGIRSLIALQVLGDDTERSSVSPKRRRRSSSPRRARPTCRCSARAANPTRRSASIPRAGALRPQQRAGHAHGRERARRHGHHLFGRGRAALSGAHPLPARAPRRCRRTAPAAGARAAGGTAPSRSPACSPSRPCTRWSLPAKAPPGRERGGVPGRCRSTRPSATSRSSARAAPS